jgi:hypothetical protein
VKNTDTKRDTDTSSHHHQIVTAPKAIKLSDLFSSTPHSSTYDESAGEKEPVLVKDPFSPNAGRNIPAARPNLPQVYDPPTSQDVVDLPPKLNMSMLDGRAIVPLMATHVHNVVDPFRRNRLRTVVKPHAEVQQSKAAALLRNVLNIENTLAASETETETTPHPHPSPSLGKEYWAPPLAHSYLTYLRNAKASMFSQLPTSSPTASPTLVPTIAPTFIPTPTFPTTSPTTPPIRESYSPLLASSYKTYLQRVKAQLPSKAPTAAPTLSDYVFSKTRKGSGSG